MSTALYARYSSEHQNPRSIEDQLQHLKRYLVQRGGQPELARPFVDAETSGAVWERPGLQSLLRELESKRVQHVFVEDISRISRDPEDLARLRKLFAFYGARLVSVDDGFELDGSAGSALAFGVKSMLSEQYLRDLGAKTKRGLMGNAREGKSTGGRIFGYQAGTDAKLVEPVEHQAAIVRRIFEQYAAGASYDRIARELNRDRIDPPRAQRRRAGGGWMSSCIREMLRNPKYVGRWSFGLREFRRHPTTRRRVARERDQPDVLTAERPELAIVERETWDRVQARLLGNARSTSPTPKRRTTYLLSSLLRCGVCGALLEISSGSSDRYYRCSASRKRGTCENRLSVRESLTRTRVIEGVRETLAGPKVAADVRKRLAERLGGASKEIDSEIGERRARLSRSETRIRAAIAMQLDGDRSPSLAEMRRDLEASATLERAAIGQLRERANAPVPLAAIDQLTKRVLSLVGLLESKEPERAREALRSYLRGGQITLTPEQGVYIARAELFPLKVALDSESSGNLRCPELVARGRFEPPAVASGEKLLLLQPQLLLLFRLEIGQSAS
ncbi:MAG TPA: recombinase family protein [Polyangiaceae bacterium]|nr:recombinase family protein [Polyangiaceae bacterium]